MNSMVSWLVTQFKGSPLSRASHQRTDRLLTLTCTHHVPLYPLFSPRPTGTDSSEVCLLMNAEGGLCR
jgi:hypothetical protein